MPAGRKPLPTKVKQLRGNPGKRKLNKNEPQPPTIDKKPRAPRHLNKAAQKEWRRVVGFLTQSNVVTELDLPAVEAYCHSYALWLEANEKLDQLGPIVKTSNGNLIQNPYLSVSNRAMKEMRRWMTELGMTPSSRSRVQAVAAAEVDELEQFLNEFSGG